MLVSDSVTLRDGKPSEIRVNHFDNHLHGRKLPLKNLLLSEAAKRMNGGSLEPNVNPHIFTCDDAGREFDEAREIAPDRSWYVSIYLTPETKMEEVLRAWLQGLITHVKWYPPHGSTHTAESVQPEHLLDKNGPTGRLLSMMAEYGIPLKNHGEVAHWQGEDIDAYDRERIYYTEIQPRLPDLYPGLRQILAHISTEEAVRYAEECGDPDSRIFEVTAHHAAHDRRILYDGGYLQPDHHCLPVVKGHRHFIALRMLMRKRPKYLVAGSDMAAHPTTNKYTALAFGGYYTYHCALELYVQELEKLGILDYAQDFLYDNARKFHGNRFGDQPQIRLIREPWKVSSRIEYEGQTLTPFGYHDEEKKRVEFQWKLADAQ